MAVCSNAKGRVTDLRTLTLSLGRQFNRSQHTGAEWRLIIATSTIIIIFFAQKTFIQGIALTELKG
jgi:hypothetical protein